MVSHIRFTTSSPLSGKQDVPPITSMYMPSWYYSEQGTKRGPVSEAEFGNLVRQGLIVDNTMVWHDGMSDWMSLSDAMLADPAFDAAEEPLRWTSPQTAAQPPAWIPGHHPFASLWARLAAKVIDSVILSIPTALLAFTNITAFAQAAKNPGLATPRFALIIFLFNLLIIGVIYWYEVVLVSKSGGTLGKRLLDLKVVKEDGRHLSQSAALTRFVTQGASSMFFGFGYWMALFDSEKRTLHDRICRTRVVRGNRD